MVFSSFVFINFLIGFILLVLLTRFLFLGIRYYARELGEDPWSLSKPKR